MRQSEPPAHGDAAEDREAEKSRTGEAKEGPSESEGPADSAGKQARWAGDADAGGGGRTEDTTPCGAAAAAAAAASERVVVKKLSGGSSSSGKEDDAVVVTNDGDGDDRALGGVAVVMVEVSKKVPDLVEMATESLARHEAVCLRSLEKVWSLCCFEAQRQQGKRREERWKMSTSFVR